MNMKTAVFAAIVFAIPAFAFAHENPDGTLGTDYVGVFGTYYYDDYGYYGTGSDDYSGFGLCVNKNVIDSAKYGVDAYFKYYHITDSSADYDYTQNSFVGSATAFYKGTLSPFVSGIVFCHNADIDYTSAAYEDDSKTSWELSLKVGVEFHIAPGLAASVAVAENHYCSYYTPKNATQYSVGLSYWFTERVGLIVSQTYKNCSHIDEYSTTFTVAYHF